MIAALNGKILSKGSESLVVDVGGVGYEVIVVNSVFDRDTSVGDEISLIVYTDVKETSISLFGFVNQLEKEVFTLLKKVKGIGSRLALTVISALGPEAVLSTIGTEDVDMLKRVPGIGKKTAERVIVELRENVGRLVGMGDLSEGIKITRRRGLVDSRLEERHGGVAGDAVLALEKLGFSSERASKAVSLAIEETVENDPAVVNDASELLKLSLARL